jgi:hypothetical protein
MYGLNHHGHGLAPSGQVGGQVSLIVRVIPDFWGHLDTVWRSCLRAIVSVAISFGLAAVKNVLLAVRAYSH